MNINKLTDDLYVAGQILPEQIPALAKFGIKAIICNRPDGEDPDQPDFANIAGAAEAAGLPCCHQPVVAATLTPDAGAEFARLLAELPRPVLAYCRTGNRCTNLFMIGRGK